MKYARLCEHDRYEPHRLSIVEPGVFGGCPGGEILTEDALVIEKVFGEWPEWITDVDGPVWYQCGGTDNLLQDIFDAVQTRRSP